MNRKTLIVICIAVLVAVLALAWYQHNSSGLQPAGSAEAPSAPASLAPAAPDMAVGASCQGQCNGKTIAITCAEGETPVCDCQANPNTACLPPPR